MAEGEPASMRQQSGSSAPGGSSGGSSRFGFLGRKAGPLPVWVWALIAVGIYWWYMNYGPGAAKKQAAATAAQPLRVITVPGASSRTVIIDRQGGGDGDRDGGRHDHDRDRLPLIRDHDRPVPRPTRRRRRDLLPTVHRPPSRQPHPDTNLRPHKKTPEILGGAGDQAGPQPAAAPLTGAAVYDAAVPAAGTNGVVYDDTQVAQADDVQPVYPEGQYVPAGT